MQRRLESLPKSLGRAVDASRPSCSVGDPKALGHALKKLKRSHRSHKKELKRLWKDWHKTQRDIANLGSEVLGASRLVVVQDGTSRRQSSRKKKEPRAVTHQSHKIKQNEKVEFDSLLSNEVAKIRDMSRKAIAKARSRAKVRTVCFNYLCSDYRHLLNGCLRLRELRNREAGRQWAIWLGS